MLAIMFSLRVLARSPPPQPHLLLLHSAKTKIPLPLLLLLPPGRARVPPLHYSCVSDCSLVAGSEQRAIWASLHASSGGPRHAQTAASIQHLSAAIKEPTVEPSLAASTTTSLPLPPKTFHTLQRGEKYAKRLAPPPPFLVLLRLCRFPPLVFTLRGPRVFFPRLLCFLLLCYFFNSFFFS